MTDMLYTLRVLGLRRILRLYRAYRVGMLGIISGFYTTRTMQALFNVGLFDEMQAKGTVNLEAFAAAKGLDPNVLRALCDSLFSLRILKKDGDRYALDAKGRLLVEVARGWFEGVYGYEEVFHSLEGLLTKEKAYGKDVTRRVAFVTKGYGEIEKWIYFPLAIDMITRNGFRNVLDLGCGDGTFLRALCESRPEVTGCGIDIAPEAIAEGREKAERAGLANRLHLFVEDISKLDRAPDPLRRVDMATTFFVLHELLFWGPDRVIDFLRSFRTIFPGVPLIVFEVVRPTPEEMRRRPGMAIHYFLYHDLTHQKPVSRNEWVRLFQAAGFSSVAERHLGLVRTVIFTLR